VRLFRVLASTRRAELVQEAAHFVQTAAVAFLPSLVELLLAPASLRALSAGASPLPRLLARALALGEAEAVALLERVPREGPAAAGAAGASDALQELVRGVARGGDVAQAARALAREASWPPRALRQLVQEAEPARLAATLELLDACLEGPSAQEASAAALVPALEARLQAADASDAYLVLLLARALGRLARLGHAPQAELALQYLERTESHEVRAELVALLAALPENQREAAHLERALVALAAQAREDAPSGRLLEEAVSRLVSAEPAVLAPAVLAALMRAVPRLAVPQRLPLLRALQARLGAAGGWAALSRGLLLESGLEREAAAALSLELAALLAPLDLLAGCAALVAGLRESPVEERADFEALLQVLEAALGAEAFLAPLLRLSRQEQSRLQAALLNLLRELLLLLPPARKSPPKKLKPPSATAARSKHNKKKTGKRKAHDTQHEQEEASDEDKEAEKKGEQQQRRRRQQQQKEVEGEEEEEDEEEGGAAEVISSVIGRIGEVISLEGLVTGLPEMLTHREAALRRRALRLLNERLQHLGRKPGAGGPLVALLPSLAELASRASEGASTRQAALLSLEILCRHLGPDQPPRFLPLVPALLAALASREAPVRAAACLSLGTWCASLQAAMLPHLPALVPQLLALLGPSASASALLPAAALSALRVVVTSLPQFLSPYLPGLLGAVFSGRLAWDSPAGRAAEGLLEELPVRVPARQLMPALLRLVQQLQPSAAAAAAASAQAENSARVLQYLRRVLETLPREELQAQHRALFRLLLGPAGLEAAHADTARAARALLVALTLRLSEAQFRPLLLQLLAWATERDPQRAEALFGALAALAEALRSLFVPYAGAFLDRMLRELADPAHPPRASWHEALRLLVFLTRHDQEGAFLDAERASKVQSALADLFERLGSESGEEEADADLRRAVSEAVAELAARLGSELRWKPLNQVLLRRLRSARPGTRLAAIEALESIYERLGEDYLALLPESVPFLAELLEDPAQHVEAALQRLIQRIDSLLGEGHSIRQYFGQ
jgi:hypothetical protein